MYNHLFSFIMSSSTKSFCCSESKPCLLGEKPTVTCICNVPLICHHTRFSMTFERTFPAKRCTETTTRLQNFDGGKSPQWGIETRSPAWQAGILTTILPRMLASTLSTANYSINNILYGISCNYYIPWIWSFDYFLPQNYHELHRKR